jgi:hypothetical protein
VTWSESLHNIGVIFTALIRISNQQRDRSACGSSFEYTRKDLYLIGLIALGNMARGPGSASVKIALDIGFRQCHTRWAAIDHAAYSWAVGFAKIGNAKQSAKSATGHEKIGTLKKNQF